MARYRQAPKYRGPRSLATYRRAQAGRNRAAAMAYRRRAPILVSTGELKGMDTELTLNPIISTTSTNASSFTLNLVRTGNGAWARIGRKIRMKSVRLTGALQCTYGPEATTGALLPNSTRMVVVYDKQPSGTLPTFDTIFGHTVQDGTESSGFRDALRFDNTERFIVLRDKICDFVPQAQNQEGGTTDTISQIASFDEYINLKGLPAQYSGESEPMTIADISSGALYVFFRSATNASATLVQVKSTSTARLRYTDQ